MKEGSRILIMDMVLPAQGTCSPTLEAALRQKDLMMRQVLWAHEREVEDWQELITRTGGRLRIVEIRQLESSRYVPRYKVDIPRLILYGLALYLGGCVDGRPV
jgi:6-hydroxytryprostatin B O-methyltransferase